MITPFKWQRMSIWLFCCMCMSLCDGPLQVLLNYNIQERAASPSVSSLVVHLQRCLQCSTTVCELTWHEPKRAEPGVFIAQPGWRSQNPALLRFAPQWANIWSRSTLNTSGWPELGHSRRDRGIGGSLGPPWWSRAGTGREDEAANIITH